MRWSASRPSDFPASFVRSDGVDLKMGIIHMQMRHLGQLALLQLVPKKNTKKKNNSRLPHESHWATSGPVCKSAVGCPQKLGSQEL